MPAEPEQRCTVKRFKPTLSVRLRCSRKLPDRICSFQTRCCRLRHLPQHEVLHPVPCTSTRTLLAAGILLSWPRKVRCICWPRPVAQPTAAETPAQQLLIKEALAARSNNCTCCTALEEQQLAPKPVCNPILPVPGLLDQHLELLQHLFRFWPGAGDGSWRRCRSLVQREGERKPAKQRSDARTHAHTKIAEGRGEEMELCANSCRWNALQHPAQLTQCSRLLRKQLL